MSVASRNPFALLDEAADSRPASPPPKAPAPAPASTRGTNQKSRGGPASRGGKYYARGGAKSTQARDGPTDDSAEPAPRKFDGERGRGRGRGGRGSRGGERGGRRQFDRHSATGKTDSDKKVHQGWGGDDGNRELQDETTANVDAAAEAATPADAWGAEGATSTEAWGTDAADGSAPATDAKPDGRPPRREEEEDNTLTLDQYMAQKKDLAAVPKLETRKANEGTAGNWKDVVPLQKGEEDAYFVGKGKSAPKTRAKKEEKVFIEIDAHFERPSRGGGRGRGGDRGRGGSGRGGRGAGRGRPNGNNNSAPTVNVDDETAFPSLS